MIWWAKKQSPQAPSQQQQTKQKFCSWADVRDEKFRILNGRPRKKYERNTPYPQGTKHIPFLQRERVAFIKIRRQGVSVNQIATAFGRSTSQIFKVIKNAESFGVLRRFSKRTMPNLLRRRSASFCWQTLMKLLPRWVAWILGEEEKPP